MLAIISILLFVCFTQTSAQINTSLDNHMIHPLSLRDVKVTNAFWSPKYKVWDTVTVYDVFDKIAFANY